MPVNIASNEGWRWSNIEAKLSSVPNADLICDVSKDPYEHCYTTIFVQFENFGRTVDVRTYASKWTVKFLFRLGSQVSCWYWVERRRRSWCLLRVCAVSELDPFWPILDLSLQGRNLLLKTHTWPTKLVLLVEEQALRLPTWQYLVCGGFLGRNILTRHEIARVAGDTVDLIIFDIYLEL